MPSAALPVLFLTVTSSVLVDCFGTDGKFHVSRRYCPNNTPKRVFGTFQALRLSLPQGDDTNVDGSRWTSPSAAAAAPAATTALPIQEEGSPHYANFDYILSSLEALYPTTGLDQRIALSRKDGYWPYIQKGVDPPQELVYGEFDIGFFATVLERAAAAAAPYQSEMPMNQHVRDSFWKDKVFCDLGSGTGRLVLAAAALFPWKLCRGVELLDGLHQQATAILQNCCPPTDDGQPSTMTTTRTTTTTTSSFFTSNAALPVSADDGAISSPASSIYLSPIQLDCGSFDDPYQFFGDADIIFVFSSCMNPPILINLARAIGRQCRPGCLILTTEYTLPHGEGVSYVEPLQDDPEYPSGPYAFELVESITGPNQATGGESTVHIHRLVQAVGTGLPRTKPPVPGYPNRGGINGGTTYH